LVKDRSQSTIFEVDKPHISDLHPITKPVELIARMIENSSREDEIVYDPFSASGSTLLAAHQLNRYGVEIDPGCVAVTRAPGGAGPPTRSCSMPGKSRHINARGEPKPGPRG